MKPILGIMLFLLFVANARAELMIEITQGMDNPTPVAIIPVTNTPALSEDIPSIVAADLQRSGLFYSIPRKDMLSFPQNEKDVFYRDWRILGAEYLVLTNVNQGEGTIQVNFGLYDVLGQKKVLQKSISGTKKQLRDLAHAISDTVYETITGIPGAFSTKILYIEELREETSGRYRLVMADADGARDRVIFSSSEPLLSPSWSNDLKRVTYVSFETSRPAIFIQELATGIREQVTDFRGLNGAPAWSPDDSKLAMVLSKDGNPEIYVLELNSRKLTRITNHFAIDTEPNWTNDGKAIIFTSNRGGNPQIYQVTLASGRVERLTFEGDYNARPRISPDGKSIVMVHRYNDVFHIAWQNIATGDLRILTKTWLDESPSIAPNGAMLLYATQHNNKGVLAAVSMDAGVKFRLPSKQGNVREPAWSPFISKQ